MNNFLTLTVSGNELGLVVPSTVFVALDAKQGFLKRTGLGRFGKVIFGFPLLFVKSAGFDTATVLVTKIYNAKIKGFVKLLRGYFKRLFLTVKRGFRSTLYQFGLGFKSYYYPFQFHLLFKVGRSSRTLVPLKEDIYRFQAKKRRRRTVLFSAIKEHLMQRLAFIQLKKKVATYSPRKGVYIRGLFYLVKKSGKLARKGKKK